MDIETLRLFRDVSRRLSFAAVAEERGLHASSVSRSVGQLEATFGARLFQRTTRRMALTEAGHQLLRRTSVILEELDAAQEELAQRETGPSGTLRLSASVAFGERVIMPILGRFREQLPDLKLDLILSDANLDLVADGIDLAVRLRGQLSGDLVATKLMTTRYRVCASPTYLHTMPPLRSPDDLSSHRCVLYTMPAFRSQWIFRDRAGLEEIVPVDGDIAVSSALSLRTAILDGMGPGMLADWLIGDDFAKGRLIDLFPHHAVTATTFETAAWLVCPSRFHLPQKVRATIDFLRSELL